MKIKEQLEEHSLKRLVERQAEELEERRKELAQAQARIRELEDVLKKECDYATVCKHFPGAETLEKDESS